MLPPSRPGDFAQALMELGAMICKPRQPECGECPFGDICAGRSEPHRFPRKAARAQKPRRRGAAFLAFRKDGALLLERRPDRGLLGAMTGLPGSDWSANGDGDIGEAAAPLPGNWRRAGEVTHVFTHFTLDLALFRADRLEGPAPEGCWWSEPGNLRREALPTLFRKAIRLAGGAS